MQCEEFIQRPVQQGPQRLCVQCIKPSNPPNLSVNCNSFVPLSGPGVGARDAAEQGSLGHADPSWLLTSGHAAPWRNLLLLQAGDGGCTKTLYGVSWGWRPPESQECPLITIPGKAGATSLRCCAEPGYPWRAQSNGKEMGLNTTAKVGITSVWEWKAINAWASVLGRCINPWFLTPQLLHRINGTAHMLDKCTPLST